MLLGLRVPKLIEEPVAPLQVVVETPEVPIQKVSDSSTLAVRLICCAVEAATTPLSTPVVKSLPEKVFILT